MKTFIISIFTSIIKLLLVSGVCYSIYEWNNLSQVFGSSITYSQWIAIVAIIHVLTPESIPNSIKLKNDE